MKAIFKLLINALAVYVSALIIPGIHMDDSYWQAIIVALVLSLLNVLVRPILVVFTIPITVFTLGLFLLVINALMIMLAGWLLPQFHVDGFWWALLFSIILAVINSILEKAIFQEDNRRR